MVGALLGVPAHRCAQVLLAADTCPGAAVSARRAQPWAGNVQPGPAHLAAGDPRLVLEVDVVQFGHDPRGRNTGQQHSAQVVHAPYRLPGRGPLHLAVLVAFSGPDRHVRMRVDEARDDVGVTEIQLPDPPAGQVLRAAHCLHPAGRHQQALLSP